MLAPSVEGLILYQVYGNLYAMTGRKANLLEEKKIPSVGVFSTWMAFGENTRDLDSFKEETDEITDLPQILEEVLLTKRGDGVAGIKRRGRDPSSDGVRDLVTAQPPWEMRILSVLFKTTPNLATRAIGIPLRSPSGTTWYLFDPTPSGKERACVYFNFSFAIKLATGLNVFQQDPSPHGRILLLVFLLNSFHREGPQNSAMISRCSNNIMENLYQKHKHGLVSKTY
nr:hypothetical protein [Tanacetum cinerariifolium]